MYGSSDLTPKPTVERIKSYLREGKRFDGRALDEYRDLVVENNVSKKAEGSVRVKLGKTEVIGGVKVKVAEPYPDNPNEGNLMVGVNIEPMSSPRYELGPAEIGAIELSRVIDRGIREGGVVDLSQLAIKEGEKVWNLFVDIYTINDDGNLMDASGIAALAALMDAKLPKYDEKNDEVLYGQPDKDLPLNETKLFPITFRKIGDQLVVDPTKEEEDSSEGRLTIGVSNDQISSMQKGDIASFSEEEVMKSVEIAEKLENSIFDKIEKSLKK